MAFPSLEIQRRLNTDRLLYLKIDRGGSRAAATSKIERFVIIHVHPTCCSSPRFASDRTLISLRKQILKKYSADRKHKKHRKKKHQFSKCTRLHACNAQLEIRTRVIRNMISWLLSGYSEGLFLLTSYVVLDYDFEQVKFAPVMDVLQFN